MAEMNDKLAELAKKQRETLEKLGTDFKEKAAKYKACIYTCNSTGCNSGGAAGVIASVRESLVARGLENDVRMVSTGCMGLCELGPLARVEIKGYKPVLFKNVTPMLARLIVAELLIPTLEKKPAGDTLVLSEFLKKHELSLDIPFFAMQRKVVLEHLGHSDPDDLGEYIALGGYEALKKVLDTMKPEEVIAEIKKSGLRGRGGGGFPTGLKWEALSKSPGPEKFIICNGDEGDPGAYMDACILGGGSHAVLEGMMIAAYATGANAGWFYVRAEYPLAVLRVENAIKQAKKYGLLGKNILGSGFDFMAELRLGAGAFVCGEETALMASIEGKRGYPRPRPPFPTQSGLWDKPSCINNVETWANVPKIISRGADWFSSVGTATSKGTKVFALTGKVKHSGLVEIPMGLTLNDMVNKIGDGTSTGKPFKAVQTGGPSGGVIPGNELDMPICYEELKKIGSMMGSGGMVVMDDTDSMVNLAKFYLGFTVEESCGKCAPCRIGGYQMLQIMEKITAGKATKKDIETLRGLAKTMQKASLCGLGQTAPNPVISTLKYFEDEYLALLKPEDGEEANKEKTPKKLPAGTPSPKKDEACGCGSCSGCR